ncbi:hypothetical protein CMK19_00405 [Candidatus Poribacteria bacterium]|nr:hypothetical protein [Candidatus Poribacteria bacterium]|tara:strand:+ start:4202 stop:4882 length:681 start_codon:yes stop_codon:yes gene_type:complete
MISDLNTRAVADFVGLITLKGNNLSALVPAEIVDQMPDYFSQNREGEDINRKAADNRAKKAANTAIRLGLVEAKDHQGNLVEKYDGQANVSFTTGVQSLEFIRERLDLLDLDLLNKREVTNNHLLAARSFLDMGSENVGELADRYTSLVKESADATMSVATDIQDLSDRLQLVVNHVNAVVSKVDTLEDNVIRFGSTLDRVESILSDLVERLKRVKTGFFSFLLGG